MKQTFNDWRLPTIQELLTLVDYGKNSPASSLKDTKSECYWSSTPYISDSKYVWFVSFYYGCDNFVDMSRKLLVRCVRDGESGLEWSITSKYEMTYNEAIEYASSLVDSVYFKG